MAAQKEKATGQTTDRHHKNFQGRLVAHEMNSIHFSQSTYKILHLLLQQPSSAFVVSCARYSARHVCLPLALETHYEYHYLKYSRLTKVDTDFI